jgi:hypothetical protein
MEYVVGSIITLATIFVARIFYNATVNKEPIFKIRHTQSYVFNLIRPGAILFNFEEEPLVTQSIKHYQKNNVRILVVENKAYWIKDNAFYVANMIDGYVDTESAEIVDTIGMDKVELDKMMFIVEKLTEGR